MKRTLVFITLLLAVLLCRTPTAEALTYGAEYYRANKQRLLAGVYKLDPLWLFMNEQDEVAAGTSGFTALLLTPGTQPSADTEGTLYYDSASNGLILRNNSAWVTIDTAGASSLGTAYTVGSKITAGTLEVEIEVADGSNNPALRLDFDDATTDNQDVLIIDNAGDDADAVSIQINGAAGDDIRGTSDLWSVSWAGVADFVGGEIGNSDLTFTEPTTNDVYLLADADAQLTIGGASKEDINLNFATSNSLVLSSGTGTDTIAFGAVDDLTGVATVVFDAETGSSISITGNATSEHLTIQQLGTESDAGLILASAGTGTDAIKVNASGGGLDVDAADSTITITNTASGAGNDLTIEVDGDQNASVILTSDGTGGDAVSLITSAATGDIKVASGDEIDIDAVDNIAVDISGAGANFDLDSALGSVYLDGGEAAANAIVIDASNAAGGIDVDAGTGGISIDITGAADFKIDSSAGSIYLDGGESAVDAIKLDASATAGGIDIDAGTGGITIDSDGIISIDGADDINLTLTSGTAGEDLTIAVGGTGNSSLLMSSIGTGTDAISLQATGASGGIDIDTTNDGAISIVSTDDLTIEVTAGSADEDIIIQTTGATDNHILLDSEGTSVNTIALQSLAGGLDIDAKNDVIITVASTGAGDDLALVQTGAVNAGLTVAVAGTGDDAIDLAASAGGVDVSGAKSVTLTSTEGSADSVVITSTNGGIDLITTGAAATEDIDITSSASVNITSAESAAQTIVIATTGGGDATETIDITNDQGTAASATTQTDAAIQIEATVGGISLESGLSGADAIRLETSESGALITVQAIAATGASATTEVDAAIQLYAEAGGIGLTSDLAAADAVRIEAQGADGIITVQNILGTTASAATEFDASIQLYSQVGGVGLHSKLNGADAIRIEEGGGTSGTINIHANTGNAVADGAASINLLSDVGGISLKATANTNANAIWIQTAGGVNLDAGAALDVDVDGGQILLTATHNVANSILLHADAGNAQEINLLNDEGAAAGAIDLTATAGGIAMSALDDFIVTLNTTAADDDMTFQTSGSDDTHIEILADGTSENAITITASAGNIDIQGDGASGEDMDIVSTNSALNLSSGETNADAISITASTGAGGVTIDSGSSGVTFSDDPITDVGDLDCDDIIADANASVILSAVKMLVVTISVDGSPATDFEFDDTQANKTEQGIRVGVLPANSMINYAFVKCVETLTGGGQMNLTLGTADEGNEILTVVAADTANDVMGTAAGESPEIAAGTAAINVWINGTPVTNDWDEISAGSWDVCIVYTDYAAALTQTGT